MPEGVTVPAPSALYLLDGEAFQKIYGEEERAAVVELTDGYGPPQTRDSVAKNPGVLAEAEVIAYGSTVGLVSLGMVGRLVRERLRPFDLRVVACDPYVTSEEAHVLGVDLIPLEDLFASSEVVSLHAPWLPETEGMIQGSHLASMKRNATLINTSRGAVVREAEMVEILEARPDLWAVLDVTHPEPREPGSRLYDLPNVVLTPHIAGTRWAASAGAWAASSWTNCAGT
jgi:phosphoglycerate dehydrogenase-like enzyme